MSSTLYRRHLLQAGLGAGLLGASACAASTQSDATSGSVVRTRHGTLQGRTDGSVHVFQGVPYAEPPVGPLRFRAPRPLRSWRGTRLATQPGQASYQFNASNSERVLAEIARMNVTVPGINSWPEYAPPIYFHTHSGEDCLSLNIWAPANARGRRLPVYLYYHGGANTASSGAMPLEYGANLAEQEDIIVVRPNYRMGALGWVHFGLVSDELSEAVNLGIQDQFVALKWVHENIEAFGGDPDNITIGGESAGATAVSHLLTLPRARPYFRRAIIQSLSPFMQWSTQPADQARAMVQRYLDLLEIDDPRSLTTIDPDRLLAVQGILARYMQADDIVPWRPLGGVVDGEWVRDLPAAALSQQRIDNPPPVILGFAKDEWLYFRGHSNTIRNNDEAAVQGAVAQVFGENGPRLVEAYRRIHPDHSTGRLLADIVSFEFFKFSSLAIARNFAAQGAPIHVFQFSYDLPGVGGYLGAPHTGDIPFLWRNISDEYLSRWPNFEGINKETVRATTAAIGSYYGEFIRSGRVADSWPAFEPTEENVLWFGEEVRPVKNLLTAEWAAVTQTGISDVPTLETRLIDNLQTRLAARG